MAGREIKAGEAFVEITLRGGQQFQRTLARMQRRVQTFANNVGAIGKTLTAFGAAAAVPLAGAVKLASDMQETMGKFNTVFGDNAKTMKDWGDTLARQVGRSKLQIAQFLSGSQDLLVPLGFDEQTATETSKLLTQLAIDLASFNNMNDEDTFRDLQAALTGSGEVMKKYGVVVSEARVKQELLNQAIDPKNATEAEKAMARLNLILAGTTAAQGDALRTAGSFANQMKALKSNVVDLAIEVGSALLPPLAELIKRVIPIVQSFANWAKVNSQVIVTAAVVAAGVTGLGIALITTGIAANALAASIGLMAGALGIVTSPIGLVTAGILGAAAAAVYFAGAGTEMVNSLSKSFAGLKAIGLDAFFGIRDALEAGDWQQAGNIAMLGLQAAFQTGLANLSRMFENTINSMLQLIVDHPVIANLLSLGSVTLAQGGLSLASTKLQDIASQAETRANALRAKLQSAVRTSAIRANEARNRRDFESGSVSAAPAFSSPSVSTAQLPTSIDELTQAIKTVAVAVSPETIIKGTAEAARRASEVGRDVQGKQLSEAQAHTKVLNAINANLRQGGTIKIVEGPV